MKHLLKLGDLSREEILGILNLADQLKFERKNNIHKDYLKGKKLGMIFRNPRRGRGCLLKWGCMSWADMRSFCPTATSSWAEASP